jgi:threonine dehydratase
VLDLAAVRLAAERIGRYVVRTPLERSPALSAAAGADVWLKLECFQATGSFKLRGALNALLSLPEDELARGVLTVSAGNHGLGLARAARLLGVAATVVVPERASTAKVDGLRAAGVELLLRGADYDAAEAFGRRLARERRLPFVSAYNDPAVVAGAGTIALEVLDDLPGVRALVVPVGGGGLVGGIGLAVHGLDTGVAVYGAQSVASPALHAALAAGRLVPVPVGDSLADGLAGNVEPGSITWELARQHVAQIALVEEPSIARAMRFLLWRERVLVEGAAAVGPAALLERRLPLGGRPTAVVLTGRNVAADALRQHVLSPLPPGPGLPAEGQG